MCHVHVYVCIGVYRCMGVCIGVYRCMCVCIGVYR